MCWLNEPYPMTTKKPRVTRKKAEEAAALRRQAAQLLEQAEAIDRKSPYIIVLDWGDSDPSPYIEYAAADPGNDIDRYMQKHYEVSGFKDATVCALDYVTMTGG